MTAIDIDTVEAYFYEMPDSDMAEFAKRCIPKLIAEYRDQRKEIRALRCIISAEMVVLDSEIDDMVARQED